MQRGRKKDTSKHLYLINKSHCRAHNKDVGICMAQGVFKDLMFIIGWKGGLGLGVVISKRNRMMSTEIIIPAINNLLYPLTVTDLRCSGIDLTPRMAVL